MELSAVVGNLETLEAEVVIVLRAFGHTDNSSIDTLIASREAAGDFEAEQNQTLLLFEPIPGIKRLLVVGLGQADTIDGFRQAAATGIRSVKNRDAPVLIVLPDVVNSLSSADVAQGVVEGLLLGAYMYHGQKTSEEKQMPGQVTLIVPQSMDRDSIEFGMARGQAYARGTLLARDLVNLPPNICTPAYLAQQAMTLGEQTGLRIEVLEEQQMRALKMGALLAVAQGSNDRPRFIIMQHNADRANDLDTVVLVGKGVTFDTGGYSLKTRDGMIGMKADMGGGAAVMGAMLAVQQLDLPLHVVGLIPASDNNVSSGAYRPQEVLTASNGKTIEVISTDAEGRLLLADALVYAGRFSPSAVVDIATLTGACVVALGHAAAGLFSTSDGLRDKLLAAAEQSAEPLWPLPLFQSYHRAIESQTADIKNSGGRMNGVGTSAAFLQNFVDYPAWAHIDMAGMVEAAEATPVCPDKGATGYGARLLAQFVELWAKRG